MGALWPLRGGPVGDLTVELQTPMESFHTMNNVHWTPIVWRQYSGTINGGFSELLSEPAPWNDQIKSILYNAMFTLHGLHCSPVYLLRLFIHSRSLSYSLSGTHQCCSAQRPLCRVVFRGSLPRTLAIFISVKPILFARMHLEHTLCICEVASPK